jgi:hypothetical protein
MLPPISPTGILKFEWIDPGGTTRDLTAQTSPRLFVSKGATGLGTAAVEFASDKIPYASGALVRHANVPPRQIELPITIIEDSLGDLALVADALRDWFGTADERRLTPGYLRVTRPDQSVRQIACYYQGGLDGDLGTGGPNGTTYVVSLYAPDPWPTAGADTVWVWDQDDLGEVIVINEGELDAYPIWGISHQAANPTFTLTTATPDEFWALTANGGLNQLDGQSVTVDTRPAAFRTTLPIITNTGVSRYNLLDPQSSLFWLAPGENRVNLAISGTNVSTGISLTYLARYRGLLR